MGWEIDFSEDTMRVLRPKFGDPALVTRHSDKPSRCSHSHVADSARKVAAETAAASRIAKLEER